MTPLTDRQEVDKNLWVKIPEWIYIGSKEIEIKYQRPDGGWYISSFVPWEKHEVDKQALASHSSSLVERVREKKLLSIAKYGNMPAPHDPTYKEGYNEALDTVLSLLEKEGLE